MTFDFHNLKEKELLFIMKAIAEEDCVAEDFLGNSLLEDFLIVLTSYNLVYKASDNRILLTSSGQKLLETLSTLVDFNAKDS